MSEIKLTAQNPMTQQLKTAGIYTWTQLLEYVKSLPYGRNSDRSNFDLVIIEQQGSCSSKHAFLKQQADLNGIKEVELILAIYKMNNENTPGIGSALGDQGLSYLPEAHCYLRTKGQRIDLTNSQSDITRVVPDLLAEQTIQPEQVISYKVELHQKFIRQWLSEKQIPFSFKEIWQLREACIEKLTNRQL